MIVAANPRWSTNAIPPTNRRRARSLAIEFIGTTGTGKTTLLTSVEQILSSQGYAAKEAQEALLSHFGLDFIQQPKVQSFVAHLLVLPFFLQALLTKEGRTIFSLAVRIIFRDAKTLLVALMLLRNVMKRIGLHQAMQKIQPDLDFLLYDEGTLHCAHNLFVHTRCSPNTDEIRFFADWVPLPDLVIWVTAPVQQSAACIMQRGHPRVESILAKAEAFADNADMCFRTLCSHGTLQDRLYQVDNTANGKGDAGKSILKRATDIANRIKGTRSGKIFLSRAS